MNPEKRIIEVDGIKLEVDLRTATKIENYRVGDNVRLLTKDYADKYKVHPAVIVGFDAFEKLPTIVVAYLDLGYSTAEIKFAYINDSAESKDSKVEIAPATDLQELHFRKSDVVGTMVREIEKKNAEIQDLQMKKSYFEKYFSKYFEVPEKQN